MRDCRPLPPSGEFEGTRKSCRRKLKRHNERRRVEHMRDSEDEGAEVGDSVDVVVGGACVCVGGGGWGVGGEGGGVRDASLPQPLCEGV
jgi:hypothetical protein